MGGTEDIINVWNFSLFLLLKIGSEFQLTLSLSHIASASPNVRLLINNPAYSRCERAVEFAANVEGIVFIRTGRPATPVIYENDEHFEIGIAKVCHGLFAGAYSNLSLELFIRTMQSCDKISSITNYGTCRNCILQSYWTDFSYTSASFTSFHVLFYYC